MIQIEKQAAHVRSLQSMFNAIDTDNSTFVNYEELKAAMESERRDPADRAPLSIPITPGIRLIHITHFGVPKH